MEPNTQKVVVMGQGDREFQTETASSEVVHDVSAEAASSEVVHDVSAEAASSEVVHDVSAETISSEVVHDVTAEAASSEVARDVTAEAASSEVVRDVSAGADPTQIRSSNGQVEAVEEVDPSLIPQKLLTMEKYQMHTSVATIMMTITFQPNGSPDKDSSAVLAVIFLMNCAVASRAMSQTYFIHQLTPKVIIYGIAYNLTRLLFLYLALSIIQPDWFGNWWGFVIVCIIATAYSSYKCSDELKTKFTRCCEKVVLVMSYVIGKVIKHIRKDQAPPASAPARASV